MGNRYKDRHQYFDELVETSTAFYVDYIRQYTPVSEGTRVLEVGCGEGGNLLPFALIGCEVTGVDFSEKKIENARNYFRINGTEGSFFCADFFDFTKQDKAFDVILVHDVIEHIAPEDKGRFLERIHTFLAPEGVAFLAFPAWQMPFGGHPVDPSTADAGVSGNPPHVQGTGTTHRRVDGHTTLTDDCGDI